MTPILLSDPDTKLGFLADSIKCEVTEERNGSFELALEYPVAGQYFSDISAGRYMKLLVSTENSYTGIFPYVYDDDKLITLTDGTVHVTNNSGIEERILLMDFSSYFENGEEKNETNLKARVDKYLEDNDINAVEGSMTVSMIDLSKSANAEFAALETVSLCDTVKVVNTLMDVTLSMKVIKTVYDSISERYKSLELGTPSGSFADVIKQTNRTANRALEKATEVSKLEQEFQNELDEMTKAITGASGGHVVLNPSKNPQELLILIDSDNIETATKLYRFNAAGLAYSSNGYDGPYSAGFLGADGKLIINNVTARSISADLIRAGTISSESGDLLINLNSSTVTAGAISETKTVLQSGHIDLYYNDKYSGRIGQTADNNIAIEGTNPNGGASKQTNLDILDGQLFTNTNARNIFAGITHCRKTQYASTASEFSAYMKLGIGVRESSPTIAMELFPIILNFAVPERINDTDVSEFDMIAVFSGTYGSFKKIVENNTLSLTSDLTQTNYVDVSVQFVKDNKVKWESFKKRFYFADGNDDSGINVIDTAKAEQRENDRSELAGVVTELTGEDYSTSDWDELMDVTAELPVKTEQDIVDLTGYSELTNAFRQATTAPSLLTGGYNLNKDESDEDILVKLPYLYTPNAKYSENTPISSAVVECSFDVSASGDSISHYNEVSMFNQRNRSQNLKKLKLTSFERIAYGDAIFSNLYGPLSNLVELTLEEGNNYRDEYSAGYYKDFFLNCRKLEAILGTPLDMSRGTTYRSMFRNCESLRYVRFKPGTICHDLDLSACPALIKKYEATTDDPGTLLSIINGVRDYTGAEDPITIKFSTFVKSFLSSWRCTIDDQTGLYVYSDKNSDFTMWSVLTNLKGVVIS